MSQVRAMTGDDNDRVDPARPLLELTGATVRFGEETALDGVDFRMFPGEVHSLMGENGAGKSTVVKAITGALAMESGTLRLEGQQVTRSSCCRTCRWPRTSHWVGSRADSG